jgi:peptidoglycan biosynthesis protein MviN/MurJ (putative lipid II flippase)
MSRADTIVMAMPFICYTLGLIGFSCEMIINQTFYAMTNVWTPTLVGFGTTVLWMTVAYFGVQAGGAAGWGLAALAGAESLSKSAKCLIMWTMLRRDLGDIHARENWAFFGKIAIASLVGAAVAWIIGHNFSPVSEVLSRMDKIKVLLSVCFAGCSGLLVFMIVCSVLDVREVRQVIGFVVKLRQRFAR